MIIALATIRIGVPIAIAAIPVVLGAIPAVHRIAAAIPAISNRRARREIRWTHLK